METTGILAIAIVVGALAAAWAADVLRWRRMPLSDLERMASADNWKAWKGALVELRRRGENIERFAPLMVQGLFADTAMAREGARVTLSDMFPEIRPQLSGFKCLEAPEVLRTKFGNLRLP